jgi:dTDP-glucose 4,6-dehydratase
MILDTALIGQRLKNELGYEPKVKFEVGLRETINWYRNNETWWKPLKNRAEF